jgi:exopolysaccharide biosynthesis protein
MSKKIIIVFVLVLLTSSFVYADKKKKNKPVKEPATQSQKAPAQEAVSYFEHCFDITSHQTIGLAEYTGTPQAFMKENSDVSAAINGVFYAEDDGKSMGVAYLAENHNFAKRRGQIRGFFTVNQDGTEVMVSEGEPMSYDDYWLVLGTHPLLVQDGKIHSQAKEDRYNNLMKDDNTTPKRSTRSAIGTKYGSDVCFAVSTKPITMSEWAETLLKKDFEGALNLDGGPVSQLAVRGQDPVGPGMTPTKLIIFEQKR